jgi:hypothetical protein
MELDGSGGEEKQGLQAFRFVARKTSLRTVLDCRDAFSSVQSLVS